MEFHQEQEQEEDMPLPINSTYGQNHILPLPLHHQKASARDVSTSTIAPPPSSSSSMLMVVRYKECHKNHAASIGGKATDGCGEFMPFGEEGTLKSLTCSVCNCHRNFHRKEIEGDCNYHTAPSHLRRFDLGNGKNLILQGHHPKGVVGTESFKGPPPMVMSYNMAMGLGMGSFPSDAADDQEDGGFMSRYPLLAQAQQAQAPQPPQPPMHQVVKKRFRTKFTQEQKEKMVNFADKVGWKMQRQEESVVQEFCQEIGIKRRVLKVWMHNNKQNLANKNTTTNNQLTN